MANETEEFLKDLDKNQAVDVLDAPLVPETETPVKKEEEEERPKNRRERRLLEQNQRLREEAIDATARYQTLAEAKKVAETSSEEADFLKMVEPIYGTTTPEGKAATELLKRALQNIHDSAVQKAREGAGEVIEQERESESAEENEASETLDEMMEDVEDRFNVDFDSDQSARKGFLSLLEQVSPKDKEGNIVEYADPITTWKLYNSTREKQVSRAKELAGRSLTSTGASPQSTLQEDAVWRILKEL